MKGKLVYEDSYWNSWGEISSELSYNNTVNAIEEYEEVLEKSIKEYQLSYYENEVFMGIIETSLTSKEIQIALQEYKIAIDKHINLIEDILEG